MNSIANNMNSIVIDGFTDLTYQQMFDMAAAHVMANGPSVSSLGCVYAGSGCAASVFIKPECHSEADAVGSWSTLCRKSIVPLHGEMLVEELQMAHDTAAKNSGYFSFRTGGDIAQFFTEWRLRMTALANQYSLNPDVLNGEITFKQK